MSGTHSFVSIPVQISDPFRFVFRIDVVLLSLFALYVVFSIPRALAYLFHSSDIFNGFFLRSGPSSTSPKGDKQLRRSGTAKGTKPLRTTSTRTNQTARTLVESPGDGGGGGGGIWKATSGSAAPPALVIPSLSAGFSRRYVSTPRHAPTRVPRWTTIVHPTLVYTLNYRIAPGFSFGKFLLLIAYSIVVLYAAFLRSDPFTDPLRTGFVSISQIPIAMALAGKTNWFSWTSGVAYQKLNFIHRFSGRVIIITANIHVLGYLYKWSLNGTMRQNVALPRFLWGLGAVGALDLLFTSSLSFVRDRAYPLFYASHITFVACFLVSTYKHAPTTLPYILTAVGLFAFDRIARLVRTRYTKAWLTAEQALNGGTTIVHVPSLGAGWRAGQHVRLRIISSRWFGWWATWLVGRSRPFTIAAGSNSGGMVLTIKARGSWTRGLLRMSGDAADARPKEFTDPERGRGPSREVHVIVEGPYSGPGYTLYAAYSGVVLIAGGSGISYVMGVLDDLLQKHASGKSRVCVIEVIWAIQDADSLYSLLPELTPLMKPRQSPYTSLSLRFNVHWTRASSRPPLAPRTALPSGMYLRPGRPDINGTLQNAIAGVRTAYSTSQSRSRSQNSHEPTGIVIGSCGPTSLIDEATRAVGRVSWTQWNDVGGVESIEEVFGW